jgi:hypothetical protein
MEGKKPRLDNPNAVSQTPVRALTMVASMSPQSSEFSCPVPGCNETVQRSLGQLRHSPRLVCPNGHAIAWDNVAADKKLEVIEEIHNLARENGFPFFLQGEELDESLASDFAPFAANPLLLLVPRARLFGEADRTPPRRLRLTWWFTYVLRVTENEAAQLKDAIELVKPVARILVEDRGDGTTALRIEAQLYDELEQTISQVTPVFARCLDEAGLDVASVFVEVDLSRPPTGPDGQPRGIRAVIARFRAAFAPNPLP